MRNAIIFDLDETILDRTSSLRCFVEWQAYGMLSDELQGKEDAFINRFIALDANGSVWKDIVYQKLIDEFYIKHWSSDELLTCYELCFCAFAQPKIHVQDALETLNVDGYKLGLISNGNSPFQERNFRSLGIIHLFDSVIVSDAVGLRKPDPRIFQLSCRQLQISPKDAIFVGDNPVSDIAGANQVGMFTVYVPGTHGTHCAAANAVCNNFQELPEIVRAASE
ncbi:MAG: HAD family hydrolase [Chloroflexota bacterium]